MPSFKSWTSYFDFRDTVVKKSRYIHDSDSLSFLEAVVDTSQIRRFAMNKRYSLWRAQLGYDEKKERLPAGLRHPFCPDRMKPLPDRAREGRANPKGIPYLYMATHENVAMAEVRPWIGSHISLGRFSTTRDLCLVDCSQDVCDMAIWYAKEPPEDEKENVVWCHINSAFAEPVTNADSIADYVPTQIIAEQLRMSGCDGIQYRSALGKTGLNVVLFDPHNAEQIYGELRVVEGISFNFGLGINQYRL